VKIKSIRRSEALERQAAAAKRTPREQWDLLTDRVGPFGAVKERERLVTKEPTVELELAS
jgi:hypothetical protein